MYLSVFFHVYVIINNNKGRMHEIIYLNCGRMRYYMKDDRRYERNLHVGSYKNKT